MVYYTNGGYSACFGLQRLVGHYLRKREMNEQKWGHIGETESLLFQAVASTSIIVRTVLDDPSPRS